MATSDHATGCWAHWTYIGVVGILVVKLPQCLPTTVRVGVVTDPGAELWSVPGLGRELDS